MAPRKRKSAAATKPASAEEPAPATVKYKQYVGIVDTNGLDMLTELDNKSLFHATLRAEANPQRYACVFLAKFPSTVDMSKELKQCKDAWGMWAFVNIACSELQCKPEDEKTIKNIRELAATVETLTGNKL